MILNKDNVLVQVWYKMLTKLNSSYTLKDVPDIYNLREIVKELINEEEEK